MKAVLLAIVLVALLVVVSAHRRPIIKQKIQSDSDAEFLKKLGKLAKKIAPIAQKAFEVYGKVKSFGILADKVSAKNSTAPAKPKSRKPKSQKPKSQKPKSRKPKSGKPASRKPRSCKKAESRKPKSQKPKSRKPKAQKPKKVNKVEADFGALLGLAAKKLVVQKGLDLLKKKLSKKGGKKSNKTETEADAEFLKKLGKKLGGVVKKIAPIATKAFEIYSNVKSFGAASVLKKLATDKLKKLVADKIAKNPKLAKIAGFAGKAKDLIGKAKSFGLFSDSENVNCGEAYERGQRLGSMTCTTINGKLVTLGTASAFLKMKQAASKAGVTLTLNSGFRKMSEQQHLYNCYKTKKCNNGNLAAKPGFSNHQNGKALDISVVSSKTYNWLANNASKYGFVRTVPSEKWHWELRHSSCNKFVSYSCK